MSLDEKTFGGRGQEILKKCGPFKKKLLFKVVKVVPDFCSLPIQDLD